MSNFLTKLGLILGVKKHGPSNPVESGLSSTMLGDLAVTDETVYAAETNRTSLEPPIAPRRQSAAFSRLEAAPGPSLPLPNAVARGVDDPDTEPLEPVRPIAKPSPAKTPTGSGWDALDF